MGIVPLLLLHWRLLVNQARIDAIDRDRKLLMDEAIKGAAFFGPRPWE
jgi:hypothetical protein